MKELVIFDLDGTLLCTHEHIKRAVYKTLNEYSISNIDDDKILKYIGEPSEIFCKKLAPDCVNIDGFINTFRKNEHAELVKFGHLFDGVSKMLLNLKKEGFELAVCSNGSREYINIVLNMTGISDMFSYILSAKEFLSKSDAVCAIASIDSWESIIMAGDRRGDMDAANTNNIPFIAALYGYATENELNGAKFEAKAPEDIFYQVMQIAVYNKIFRQIKQTGGIRCIGINGVDTSGKSVFADRFAEVLRIQGEHVVIIHMDDFHNPRAIRLMGKNEIDAYITNAFNLDILINEIFYPFSQHGEVHKKLTLLDLNSDTFIMERKYDITQETIVIIEGVLLYRAPLKDFIDFKIFLDISFDEVIRRAMLRDVPEYGTEFLKKYYEKYIPIQQWYLNACNPKGQSNIIVDNSIPEKPQILYLGN